MKAFSKTCLQLTVILLVSLAGTAFTYYFKPDRPSLYLAPEMPDSPGVPLAEILNWTPSPVWIDARPESDYIENHIPSAISIHPGNIENALKAHFDLFIDQGTVFVIYGPSEATRTVAERFESLGQKKVHVLEGGWEAWRNHSS